MTDSQVMWGLGIMATSILGLYGIFVKLIMDQRKNGNSKVNSKVNGRVVTVDVKELVTKDICLATQQGVETKFVSVRNEVKHAREILNRVEKGMNEKHEEITRHIDSKFGQIAALIENQKDG